MGKELDELKKQIAEREKEVEYYKRIAEKAGNERLRETEELSKLTAVLEKKIQIIKEQQKNLLELNQKIEKISITDELTSLFNRRGLITYAQREFLNFKRANYKGKKKESAVKQYSCAILDLDSFKKINDTYGHLIGDRILNELSCVLLQKGIFRSTDIIGRYGGDEFLIILPNCTEECSLLSLKKLVTALGNKKIRVDPANTISITVSIGVAEFNIEDADVEKAISRADKALYHAKKRSKGNIVLFSEIK